MINKTAFLLTSILLSVGVLHAQIFKQVKQMAYNDSVRLFEIFKDLHQNPESAQRHYRNCLKNNEEYKV